MLKGEVSLRAGEWFLALIYLFLARWPQRGAREGGGKVGDSSERGEEGREERGVNPNLI